MLLKLTNDNTKHRHIGLHDKIYLSD